MPPLRPLGACKSVQTRHTKKYCEFAIDAWSRTLHHRHKDIVEGFSGTLRPGAGTFPAGRLRTRRARTGRARRLLAIALTAALAVALALAGPGHLLAIT